jgi:hypothetical protein
MRRQVFANLGRIGFFCIALVTLFDLASAAQGGCQKFAWSLAREREWFAASDRASISAGDSLAAIPKSAFTVRLLPASPRSARASHAVRQRFGAGPSAGATALAAEHRRASVTAVIDTESSPRRLWLSVAPSRSYCARQERALPNCCDTSRCGAIG